MIKRKTKYENVMLNIGENEKKKTTKLMQHQNRYPV